MSFFSPKDPHILPFTAWRVCRWILMRISIPIKVTIWGEGPKGSSSMNVVILVFCFQNTVVVGVQMISITPETVSVISENSISFSIAFIHHSNELEVPFGRKRRKTWRTYFLAMVYSSRGSESVSCLGLENQRELLTFYWG